MPDDETPASSQPESHRLRLTPEQRRVLGPARTRQDWHTPSDAVEPSPEPAPPSRSSAPRSSSLPRETGREQPNPIAPPQRRARFTRVFQPQNFVLFLAALVFLGAVFYLGKKFDYLRYEVLSRLRAPRAPEVPNRFPNLSADELIDQSLIDERLHNWRQAAEKLIAAKRKNLGYPDLLLRAGKLYYENNEFDLADALFDRSVAFRENVGEANYLRGMIASGRGDFLAAQQFYDAAAAAAPFEAKYYYSSAEALRRQHRPAEAVRRYREAALRSSDASSTICDFKMRLSAIESGEAATLSADLDKRIAAGPLPVDWLMTQAALALQAGKIDDAIAAIYRARETDTSLLRGQFAALAGDRFFTDAADKYPQLAKAIRLSDSP